ncbi:MAG: hypothetical protein BWY72_02037 [Bacteroidetes bacterium ADurb.Bin416]|nr:MAG: hypothetical protein BWY72_02037 [Bacteroidetes bacterium ADurb.Bin416]
MFNVIKLKFKDGLGGVSRIEYAGQHLFGENQFIIAITDDAVAGIDTASVIAPPQFDIGQQGIDASLGETTFRVFIVFVSGPGKAPGIFQINDQGIED